MSDWKTAFRSFYYATAEASVRQAVSVARLRSTSDSTAFAAVGLRGRRWSSWAVWLARARTDRSGSTTPRGEGSHGLAVDARERLCINRAQVGTFVFGEVWRTCMGAMKPSTISASVARCGVKVGVGAFHQGSKPGIHT
ncbi:hypothetical protein ACSSV4_002210 [Roseovarius sp. MBR-154]|jgi:hypothetical protein